MARHDIDALAAKTVAAATARKLLIATAESCTGGLVAAAITDVPGASVVFDRGFVTYSNAAKTTMLGVPPDLIRADGAVSATVARAMAAGALARSGVDVAVSITGIAGPGGGSPEKPVGLVYFGLAIKDAPVLLERRVFPTGSRRYVREAASVVALRLLSRGVASR